MTFPTFSAASCAIVSILGVTQRRVRLQCVKNSKIIVEGRLLECLPFLIFLFLFYLCCDELFATTL